MTTYESCKLGITDAQGNITILYPVTLAENIRVTKSGTSYDDAGNPNGTTTNSTSLESLLTNIGELATKSIGEIISSSANINEDDNSTQIAYNKSAINSFYKDYIAFKNSVNASGENQSSSIQSQGDLISNLQQAIEELRTNMSENNTSNLESLVAAQSALIESQTEAIQSLEETIDDLIGKIGDLEDKVSNISNSSSGGNSGGGTDNPGSSDDPGSSDNPDNPDNPGGPDNPSNPDDPDEPGEVGDFDTDSIYQHITELRQLMNTISNNDYEYTDGISYDNAINSAKSGNTSSLSNLSIAKNNYNTFKSIYTPISNTIDTLDQYNVDEVVGGLIQNVYHKRDDITATNESIDSNIDAAENKNTSVESILSEVTTLNDNLETYLLQYDANKDSIMADIGTDSEEGNAEKLIAKYHNNEATDEEMLAMQNKLENYLSLVMFTELLDDKYDMKSRISDIYDINSFIDDKATTIQGLVDLNNGRIPELNEAIQSVVTYSPEE